MEYTHLAQDERYQIHCLLKAGHSHGEVAELLGRHSSTIGRELARNGGARGYCPELAQERSRQRARNCANGPRITAEAWGYTQAGLAEDWSPEEIAERLKIEGGPGISHETIYRRIYADKRSGGSLWRFLRCQKPHRKRYGHYDRRGRAQPLGAKSIDEERPAIVEKRTTFGHWEGDTMLDSQLQSALVTLVERKSRYTLVGKVKRKNSHLVTRSVNGLLRPFKALVETITVDNGKEFSAHQKISKALEAQCYFARPYAAWQRGTNENTNGLLRQYFPRKRLISTVRPKEIQRAVDRLNHRPRKCLGFRTPHEVFIEAFKGVALRG